MRKCIMLGASFALGVLVSVAGCDKPQEVGNFMFVRQVHKSNDSQQPEVYEYTYGGTKKYLVFVRKDGFFVIED